MICKHENQIQFIILLLNFKFLLRDCKKRLSYLSLPSMPNRVESGLGHLGYVLSRSSRSDPVYKRSDPDFALDWSCSLTMVSGPDQSNELRMWQWWWKCISWFCGRIDCTIRVFWSSVKFNLNAQLHTQNYRITI